MKYEYATATGPITIEADEQLCSLLSAMDDDEGNNNRKHRRRRPVSLESCEYEGEWFEDKHDPIGDTDAAIDRERALASLTELQRTCFIETRMNGKTQRELAAELGKSRSTVQWAVDSAITSLKKYF